MKFNAMMKRILTTTLFLSLSFTFVYGVFQLGEGGEPSLSREDSPLFQKQLSDYERNRFNAPAREEEEARVESNQMALIIWSEGASACAASACAGSACIGSACAGSGCAGSGCSASGCGGSGCAGSACGGSGCSGSVCGASGCAGSVCGASGCSGSVCAHCKSGNESQGDTGEQLAQSGRISSFNVDYNGSLAVITWSVSGADVRHYEVYRIQENRKVLVDEGRAYNDRLMRINLRLAPGDYYNQEYYLKITRSDGRVITASSERPAAPIKPSIKG